MHQLTGKQAEIGPAFLFLTVGAISDGRMILLPHKSHTEELVSILCPHF
jgi:hypothetical protein